MVITKKHLSRRTLLRGAGVSVALPFLDAMLPAQSPIRWSAAAPPSRFSFVYVPHGMIMDEFTPASEGADFEITNILTPLEPFRDRLTIVSGLEARPAGAGSAGDHMRSAAAYLSGTPPQKNAGQNAYLSTTVDQVIAQKIGRDSPLASLEVGIEDTGYAGICDDGFSCSYLNTISWAAPQKPLPMERNPRVVMERLFGDGSTAEERIRNRQENGSILDSIIHEATSLRSSIGPRDRTRLDQYLDEIREIERRLQASTKASADLPFADAPAGLPQSWDEHAKLMYDLQALAFMSDITRVSTFMYSKDKINRTFPASGIKTGFHAASHTSGSAAAKKDFAQINRYHIDVLAYFVKKLQATPDGDGTLLDHSTIMLGSTMSNGDIHDHSPLPILLLGRASGQIKGGRHVRYPQHTPLSNLLLTILHKAGIPQQSFGDSTGPLEI
ncbi:MAG TPA: DUF1552 domain-containing protein [Bryobacteraceae bacterium]